MWIRKPTPVTTESMVRDRPSSTGLKPMLKSPTDIQFHSGTLTACLPLAKKVDADVRRHQRRRATEPIPTVAERFFRPASAGEGQQHKSQSMAEEWLRQACSSTQLTY